jgi:hypothetical protein
MAECSKCGKTAMTFTCRYCGEKFCSEHRLPENHDCENIDDVKARSASSSESSDKDKSSDKWFKEQNLKQETRQGTPYKKREPLKPSLIKDVFSTLKNSYTLMIILITSGFFFLQPFLSGVVVPSTTAELQLIQQNIMNLNPLVLFPSLGYLLERPWTVLTVMLLHANFFHLFANMVTFYFFGNPLERMVGGRELLKFYVAAGLFSSIGFVLFRNLVWVLTNHQPGTFGPAVGASGAVVGVFAAVAMLYPNAEVLLYFFIPMKIKTALQLFAGIEMFNMLAKVAGITLPFIGNFASSAHLAGLLIGVWYGRRIRKKHSNGPAKLDLFGY